MCEVVGKTHPNSTLNHIDLVIKKCENCVIYWNTTPRKASHQETMGTVVLHAAIIIAKGEQLAAAGELGDEGLNAPLLCGGVSWLAVLQDVSR